MPKGRPTKYNQNILDKANKYLDNYDEYGHIIPSVVGLADVLKVTAKTLYNWSEREENKEFLHILERLNQRQHIKLINGGLSGDLNAQITKLVLGKHGYHEKQERELTGPQGGPIQVTEVEWDIQPVKPIDEVDEENS